jgi:hypothetical protein
VFGGFFFISPCYAGPLGGPYFGIFACEIGQNGLHIFALGTPKNISLARAITDHRFDFVETLYSAHERLLLFSSVAFPLIAYA